MSPFTTLTVSSTATDRCIVCWRSSYQEGNCWNVLNWFNAVTCFVSTQAKTWISSGT